MKLTYNLCNNRTTVTLIFGVISANTVGSFELFYVFSYILGKLLTHNKGSKQSVQSRIVYDILFTLQNLFSLLKAPTVQKLLDPALRQQICNLSRLQHTLDTSLLPHLKLTIFSWRFYLPSKYVVQSDFHWWPRQPPPSNRLSNCSRTCRGPHVDRPRGGPRG